MEKKKNKIGWREYLNPTGVISQDKCKHVAPIENQGLGALLLVHASWTPARRIYAGLDFVKIAVLQDFFDASDGTRQHGIVMRRKFKRKWALTPVHRA